MKFMTRLISAGLLGAALFAAPAAASANEATTQQSPLLQKAGFFSLHIGRGYGYYSRPYYYRPYYRHRYYRHHYYRHHRHWRHRHWRHHHRHHR